MPKAIIDETVAAQRAVATSSERAAQAAAATSSQPKTAAPSTSKVTADKKVSKQEQEVADIVSEEFDSDDIDGQGANPAQ